MGEKVHRCSWCEDGGLLQEYHDTEWGVPVRDDRKQFEFLMMEVMQCGLNWMMMLKKREIFRSCFDGFDYEKIRRYTEDDIQRILAVPGMIRSRRKIEAVIHDAECFHSIAAEFSTFSGYIWHFYGKPHCSVLRTFVGRYTVPHSIIRSDQHRSEETGV